MDPFLQLETEKLTRSWTRHDHSMLREYLVSGVEDPRINLQSIFSRHFLLYGLKLERYALLMEHEYRFSAVMNWLLNTASQINDRAELENILYALKRGADNAEGLQIPRFVLQTFTSLPATAHGVTIPNYLESCLSGTNFEDGNPQIDPPSLDTFSDLWNKTLATLSSEVISTKGDQRPVQPATSNRRQSLNSQLINPQPLTLLEPACGSANDYRFLERYGFSRLLDYFGFDLCPANIENAHALFPKVRFDTGNVFEIPFPDKSFDLCFTHDLFEHLSLAGLEVAIREISRVTRRGLCIGFFNMDEIPEHREQPVEDYHWNKLSMARIKEAFARQGFTAQVRHIATFLRQRIGCDFTHNPNAYTVILVPA